jgi:hypothetical protein
MEYTELLEEFFVQLDPLEEGFSGALVELYQRRAGHPPLPPLAQRRRISFGSPRGEEEHPEEVRRPHRGSPARV